MKVRLITNFSFTTGSGNEYEPPPSVATVGDLLAHVGKRIEFIFMDAAGRNLRKDIELELNGKNIWFYPHGLQTPLQEGDCVDITLTPLGGG
jgi:molybdopterin converting factor small subunit